MGVSARYVPHILAAAAVIIGLVTLSALADDQTPTFLVAKPGLRDALFSESVVLMLPPPARPVVAGVIINKPTTISVSRAFPHSVDLKNASELIFFGGPVDLESILLVRKTSSPNKDERRIFGNLYLSVDPNSIAAILKDPKLDATSVRVFQGYSQWLVPQLAWEKRQDSWYEVPARAESVFTSDPKRLWKQMVDMAQVQEVRAAPAAAGFRVLLSLSSYRRPEGFSAGTIFPKIGEDNGCRQFNLTVIPFGAERTSTVTQDRSK